MNAEHARAVDTADREILVSRLFDAPRELVFDVWTDPAHVTHWWGPNGFTTTTDSMDFRPGGEWRFVMHGPDGTDYRNLVVYTEIRRPERLGYRHSGEAGGEPIGFDVTVTFVERSGKTEVTLHLVFPTAETRNLVCEKYGALEGAHHTLARLADHLATAPERELVIARDFDAPRALVFAAWVEDRHAVHWSAPRGFGLTHYAADVRRGGAWRYCMRSSDGVDYWVGGTYREIVAPERLAFTYACEDASGRRGHESLVTVTFEELPGERTRMVFRQAFFATVAERDGHRDGWSDCFDLLADYLARAA